MGQDPAAFFVRHLALPKRAAKHLSVANPARGKQDAEPAQRQARERHGSGGLRLTSLSRSPPGLAAFLSSSNRRDV
jgi:hypothetical protein